MSKEKHYWAQLRAALSAGAWFSPSPARAPNGQLLSWSELFRKFNKHCHGFKHVSEVASYTQALAILLAANFDDEDQDRTGNLPALPLTSTMNAYTALKELEAPNSDPMHSTPPRMSRPPRQCPRASPIPEPRPCVSAAGSTTLLVVPGVASAQVSMSSTSVSGSFASLLDSPLTEIRDGRAWAITETFRSLCLRDNTTFTQLRELWRWVERLLWRAIVLSSRASDIASPEADIWTWLNHYKTCSTSWPASFRTAHRSTISTLYLRALILQNGVLYPSPVTYLPSSSESTKSKSTQSSKQKDGEAQPEWLHSARQVVQDYRAILSSCTVFPSAGEQNTQVEEFVDLCVAVWEAAGSVGSHASWVIDILWWSTRLTFNSPRVLRHLSRLFYLSADPSLAKKSLHVYTQVVSKAYQAAKEGIGEDVDTDKNWVEMMVFGARMLCLLAEKEEGWEGRQNVKEAGRLIELAKGRLEEDGKLKGALELAQGVYFSILALTERDPYTRPTRLASSHLHLKRAVELDATHDAHFHLALSYSRPGDQHDLDKAIQHAGLACEGDPKDVRYWHLLGLLFSAKEKWEEAREVFEMGAEMDEEEEEEEEEVNGEVKTADYATGETGVKGTTPNGNATPNGTIPVYTLPPDANSIPPASALLKSILDKCPLSKEDRFEAALQLRMSQVALAEVMEGPEGAEERWVEVFGWVAERKRSSGDALPRPSLDLNPEKATLSSLNGTAAPLTDQTPMPATPIPITVSHASDPEPSSPVPESSMNEKKKTFDGLRVKRSLSIDRGGGKKKVGQMLKHGVHKGHAGISAVSRKVNGVVRNGTLRRSSSTPDFHEALRNASFQASSIHSRRRVSSVIHSQDRTPTESPPPPPLPPMPPVQDAKPNSRSAKENRLLSDLWLMSSATFRRLGKIEQAKGAIQEAEVRDENNPAVWVQLGLYYVALGQRQHASMPSRRHCSSTRTIRLYLEPSGKQDVNLADVDLAAGLLAHVTKWKGWDVPEAWYFLAKAYRLQNRKEKEREALRYALKLSEQRGVREISAAIGWCTI
ncbi:hypothetical protein BDQ17DRAFT_1354012 [Cyathus striatus]|nr:hypothetical protein BDQ17DRAFT_1354012 [Cyathus striatus]